jgi:6-pyruvoyltetrahydropterin/6-carboxytetrahydropterin synthase
LIFVTRRYRFSASHRLHAAQLSDAENARVFGKCNNPFGHGHDYVLEVTASGPVDEGTGSVVSLAALDRLVEDRVIKAFAFRNINLDLPQFINKVPTTENIAAVIADLLRTHWGDYIYNSRAQLRRVHLQETDRNGFEIVVSAKREQIQPERRPESVSVHE